MRINRENAFGFYLRLDTLFAMEALGVSELRGLLALDERDRLSLKGWGVGTETRFQERLRSLGL